jgi:hypothetical protein
MYWMDMKYSNNCKVCGETIKKGQRAFGRLNYSTRKWEFICNKCGDAAAAKEKSLPHTFTANDIENLVTMVNQG